MPLYVTCARFCCRLPVSCPRLVDLYLHSTLATSRAVLAALKAAYLRWSRIIWLYAPGR